MQKGESVQKGVFEAEVLSNQQIRRCYYRLNLQFDAEGSRLFKTVLPGQFLELDVSGVATPHISFIPEHLQETVGKQVFLRRPFSFSDAVKVNDAEGSIVKVEIIYCVLGPATVRMMALKPKDKISVLGPLGNGFSIPEGLQTAILIAGGMGSPPLLHLASHLKRCLPHCSIVSFVGAKSCEDLPFTVRIGNFKGLVLEEFELIQVPSFIATDDGSAGYRGFVTDCARRWLQNQTINPSSATIFACGPEAMLKSTARLAEDFSLPCQISMERMMACGIGLCQSCAVEVRDSATDTKYRLCCKDGPVFNSRDVLFQED